MRYDEAEWDKYMTGSKWKQELKNLEGRFVYIRTSTGREVVVYDPISGSKLISLTAYRAQGITQALYMADFLSKIR